MSSPSIQGAVSDYLVSLQGELNLRCLTVPKSYKPKPCEWHVLFQLDHNSVLIVGQRGWLMDSEHSL